MSDEALSRSPEPGELLRTAIRYFTDEIHTVLPGEVTEIDHDAQKVSVKPLIKRRVVTEDGSELLEELPIIPDVPLRFLRAGAFFITVPVEKGTLVELRFAERSLDNWLSGNGEDTDPDEFRTHDFSDAIATPGLYPFKRALKDFDRDRLALGVDDGGMQLHIAEDAVQITFDNGNTFTLEGKDGGATLKLGDGAVHPAIVEQLEALWAQLKAAIDVLDGHIHTTTATVGTGGPIGVISATLTPASMPAWDASINSSKVSFPDG